MYQKYFHIFILLLTTTSLTLANVELPILEIASGKINQSTLTPDGKSVLLASGSQILVWDIYKKQILKRYHGAKSDVVCMNLSQDGSMLAAGFSSGEITVWEVATYEVVHQISAHKNKITAIHIDVVNNHLASGDQSGILKSWNLETANLIHTHTGHTKKISSIDMSADGKLLLSAGEDQLAMLWSFDHAERVHKLMGHLSTINAAIFLNENTALTGSDDKTISAWDIQTGEISYTLVGHKNNIIGIQKVVNQNRFVSMSKDQQAIVWDAMTMKEIDRFNNKGSIVTHMSLQGNQILKQHKDLSLSLWDLAEQKKTETFQIQQSPILAAKVLSAQNIIISGNEDGYIKMNLLNNGDLIKYFPAHEKAINHIALSPDCSIFITVSDDKLTKLWDVQTGELLKTLEGHKGDVLTAAFSPNGDFIYTAGKDKLIKWWNLSSGIEINSFKAHSGDITFIIPLDGNKVLSVSEDRTMRIYLAEKGLLENEIGTHQHPISSAVLASQDSLLYIGDQVGNIASYHIGQNLLKKQVKIHTAAVSALSLTSDNAYLLSSSFDKTSCLMHRSFDAVEQTFSGHAAPVSYCSFGQEESTIVTTSLDSQIKVWSILNLVQR